MEALSTKAQDLDGWMMIGSISAAFSSPVYVPPHEEMAGCMSSKACL